MNDRVYTHEFIRIRGVHRPDYMHHMTANWSPNAQADRNQLCFGVWGTVGTTGTWPQVVHMWEEAGFDGLAAGLGGELVGPALQDPKLQKWWNEAANFREGGFDRVLIPAPWTRTIGELITDGAGGGAVYAHETIQLEPGGADDYLSAVRDEAIDVLAPFGWELVGALKSSMHADSECICIWAIDTWEHWGEYEKAVYADPKVRAWRDRQWGSKGFERFLMCDAPLSPMKIGRQPARSDRQGWTDL